MNDGRTNAGSAYYYVNGQRVPLVPEPGVFAVRYRVAPRLLDLEPATSALLSVRSPERTPDTLGLDLSPVAKRLLQDSADAVRYIPSHNFQVYRSDDAGRAQAVLGREAAVTFVTPAFKRSPESQSSDALYVTNQFLARFKPEATPAQIEYLCQTYGARVVPPPLTYAPNAFLFEIDEGPYANRVVAVANAFYESGLTLFAHPNFVRRRYLRRTVALAESDVASPLLARDHSEDLLYLDREWHLSMARVTDAWEIGGLAAPYGSPDIVIAIFDCGVDMAHPDFARVFQDGRPKVAGDYDFATNGPDGSPKSADDNHGTACAGVATAWGKAWGVAPGCRLLVARTPEYLGVAQEGAMFEWAADNGADVISCSWGPQDGVGMIEPLADSTRAAIHYCVTQGRGGRGIPILWAAGNGNESLEIAGQPGEVRDGYAGNPEVLAIGASTSADRRAYYSDFGPQLCVCAPSSGSRAAGEKSIFTTDRHGAAGYNSGTQPQGDTDGDYTATFGGTSSAAPLVAGIAALMLSANPELSVEQVRRILETTADRIGPASAYNTEHHSELYGYGRVNAREAVWRAMNTAPRDVAAPAQGGGGPSQPAAASPTPAIAKIGGAALRSGSSPRFQVTPGPNRYFLVELATRPELFDSTNHGHERVHAASGSHDVNFYGSWEEDRVYDARNTTLYTMPDGIWHHLKGAERIYYRVLTTSASNDWIDYQTSTPDGSASTAPYFLLQGGVDTIWRGLMRGAERDHTDEEGGMSVAPIQYEVELVPQPDKLSCWAASMAMLVGYERQESLTPETLAAEVGRSLRTSYGWDLLEDVKEYFGFEEISLPSNTTLYPPATQWYDWLNQYGPLWVTTVGAPSHAIVVHGISGDMTFDGTEIEVLNPWDTSELFSDDVIDFWPANRGIGYVEAFRDFAAEFGDLGLDDYGNWRVLYLPGLGADASDADVDHRDTSDNGDDESDDDDGGDTEARAAAGTTGTRAGVGSYTVYESEVRVGGTLAWRNNNPGNIRPSQFTRDHGSIGQGWGFAVFPDEATGFDAIIALLRNPTYQSKTIKGAIFTYAPPSDNNNSEAYVAFIRRQTGLDPQRNMSSLNDDELQAVARAIRTMEGWTPGTTYTCATPNRPDWVGPLLGCRTSRSFRAPRLPALTDRVVSDHASARSALPLRPKIFGPASYDRSDDSPSFHLTLGDNPYYAVEVTTDPRLFDEAKHVADRSDANFYTSARDGLECADGETTFTLPERIWARLKQAAFLFYRVQTSSRENPMSDVQTSLADVLASRAPAIRLTGHAGGRLNIIPHFLEEELWNADLMG